MIENLLSYLSTLVWSGWTSLLDYLAAHVLLCLIPAFVIAGYMSAMIPKEVITRYLGPKAPRCANCSKVEQITCKAVAEMGFQAGISKVTDYGEIMQYAIISTPGLVINDNVICSGRVPAQAEITTWLVDAQKAEDL